LSRKHPTLYLLAEDEPGYLVFKAILRARQINVNVKLRNKPNGIAPLALDLSVLLKSVLREKSARDCIVVLYDADYHTRRIADRRHHDSIKQTCALFAAESVICCEARDEIEAWVLADDKMAQWLEYKPQTFDNRPNAKEHLSDQIARKAGSLRWNKRYQPEILSQYFGGVTSSSPSLREAVDAVLKLPCAVG